MRPTDLAIEILKGIRDEARTTNIRIEALRSDVNSRFAETHQRLDRVERRQTEAEVRVSTELIAVVGAVREVRDLLREDRCSRGSRS
jgi:hypothetical protein